MIGYILFYKLPVIIWWQWILCRVMSAMLGNPDFRSYEWQRILCYAMRHFSCSNCVAVMLLKARGWRGTSLLRGSENAWFSNPVRVLLLPITWGYEKAEPVPGSLHASIQSPRRLTSLADVGLSKAQLVPSCPPTSRLLSCHMVITMKQ